LLYSVSYCIWGELWKLKDFNDVLCS
jgi:hypothetical protein